jgi:hypothetical protein
MPKSAFDQLLTNYEKISSIFDQLLGCKIMIFVRKKELGCITKGAA